MKNYLMFGAAALVFGATFTSCSKDVVDVNAQQQQVVTTYKQAFVNCFGQPAKDQTWGFGTSGTRGMTRAIQPSYDFPDDAPASKFLADVPEGIEKLTQNAGRVNNYIDETWQGDLNIWGAATAEGGWQDRSGGTLYIKGNCDFTNRSFYFDGHSELYLVEGATLTLNANNAANLQTYTNIYMAKDSKIVTTAELKLNNGLHIFNHGTIEAGKLSTNSDSWLVNGGTVTVTGKISVENTLSVIENNGTITAADLNTAGSGKFENNADVTITGTTFVNSNDNTWVNNGQYHTGNFIYNAASDEVINNCRLTVDEDFNINLGDNPGNGNFKMDANSGVVTKNFNGGGVWAKTYSTGWSSFTGGPFKIIMGSHSVFKVTNEAHMNALGSGIATAHYGFECVGTEPAVLEAKKILMDGLGEGNVAYSGNLYISAEEHFAQGYSGQYPYIHFYDGCSIDNIYAPGFKNGKPAVTIEETPCNPGFDGGGDQPSNPVLRVIAEDLSATEASDFDFNDVVFDVEYVSASQVKITLLAAGGTLPLRINQDDNWEVHKLFGVATDVMVNTGAQSRGLKGADKDPVELTLYGSFSSDNDEFKQQVKNIKVEVYKEYAPGQSKWYELEAPVGEPACKIGVSKKFTWLGERQSMGGVPKFVEWVTTNSRAWYDQFED